MRKITLNCYAHGYPGDWEAICTDLDIAVQGASLDEVKATLKGAISSYIEAARQESPEDTSLLLSRKSPLGVRLKLWLGHRLHRLRNREGDGHDAQFVVSCPA